MEVVATGRTVVGSERDQGTGGGLAGGLHGARPTVGSTRLVVVALAGTLRKVFIANGSSTNWGIWQRHFKHLGFVPVLGFIQALTYMYSAAMAGRSRESGAPIYVRWITAIWQGEVQRCSPSKNWM